MKTILAEIINAHGGEEIWRRIDWITADISASGFLFQAKHIPVLNHVTVRASAKRPHFIFADFPGKGQTGELIGNGEVRILDVDGNVLHRRMNPREAFKGWRRVFWWDYLDFIYFGGYATWNYLVTPFVFLREGFDFRDMRTLHTANGDLLCFDVTFPDDLPTHCRTQTFYFDKDRLLRRLDYTAEVVGPWAHAAHFCDGYRDFSGLKMPTHRLVRPKFFNRPFSGPVLVEIEIHDVALL